MKVQVKSPASRSTKTVLYRYTVHCFVFKHLRELICILQKSRLWPQNLTKSIFISFLEFKPLPLSLTRTDATTPSSFYVGRFVRYCHKRKFNFLVCFLSDHSFRI